MSTQGSEAFKDSIEIASELFNQYLNTQYLW